MLTKDFIEAVEELGYEVDIKWPDTLFVETSDIKPDTVVVIRKDEAEPASWSGGTTIPAVDAAALVKLVEEYSATPLEEREKNVSEKPLESYSINELGEAISKILLNKLNPHAQVVISQEQIQIYEPKWCTPSEWANKNL